MNPPASRRRVSSVLLTLATLLGSSCGISEDALGFRAIFDGATLAGWRAVPDTLLASWSVTDGAIQGTGLEDRLAYLVYADDEALSDFELKFSYRMLTDGNTGVELRARVDETGKRPFEGYHADLGHVGIGPMVLGAWDFHFATRKEFPCPRGTRLVISEDGTGHQEAIDDHVALEDIKIRDWNQCRILAKGNSFQFFINGKLSSEFVDGLDDGRLEGGLIALQLHDKGMAVQFRDILLKRTE